MHMLVATWAALVLLGTDTALAAEKRFERGPENVTVTTQNGQQGYWIEYEEYTFEHSDEKIAEIAAGKLTQAELENLIRTIRRGAKTVTEAEVRAKVAAIVKDRKKAGKTAGKGSV